MAGPSQGCGEGQGLRAVGVGMPVLQAGCRDRGLPLLQAGPGLGSGAVAEVWHICCRRDQKYSQWEFPDWIPLAHKWTCLSERYCQSSVGRERGWEGHAA